MYPYLHLGSFTLKTYGLSMVIAFLFARKALDVKMRHQRLSGPSADLLVLLVAMAGLIGSKLYHELTTPNDLLRHLHNLSDLTQGYAWFGGLLAGVITLCFIARRHKIPILTVVDLTSPAAALGYAIGRLGCLLAGDGDYGRPTSLPWGMSFPYGIVPTTEYVHPTQIYEFIAHVTIFSCLWRLGPPQLQGRVFAQYLLLTGAARFLVEFIRLNSPSFYGLTNAQLMSLLCFAAGAILFVLGPFYASSSDNDLRTERTGFGTQQQE